MGRQDVGLWLPSGSPVRRASVVTRVGFSFLNPSPSRGTVQLEFNGYLYGCIVGRRTGPWDKCYPIMSGS
jgi:hypothetical protein